MRTCCTVWTRTGMLGMPVRMHVSRPYERQADLLKGLEVPPDAGWVLAGVLLLEPGLAPLALPLTKVHESGLPD